MIRFLITVFFLVSTFMNLQAQSVKALEKLLEKQDFEKLEASLKKKLEKDSLDAGAYYFYSLYYLDTANPFYDIDKAYEAVSTSLETLQKLEGKEVLKLDKAGLSEVRIRDTRAKVDSLAFERAREYHDLAGYQTFINEFVAANQMDSAIVLRDSIAFAAALKADTYQAYLSFFETYPEARQVEEAKKRYHKLLYDAKTKEATIESYAAFIRDYPDNPHKPEAELHLYQLFTADTKPSTFAKFIADYPSNRYVERAWYWLWFLSDSPQGFLSIYPNFPNKDWAKEAVEMSQINFYAFIDPDSAKFGFMDQQGKLMLAPSYEDIGESYRCSGVFDDFIVVVSNGKTGAIDKKGRVIVPYEFDKVAYFAPGVLLTVKNKLFGLYHQAGFKLMDNQYDDVQLLSRGLVSVKKYGALGIRTMNDQLVLPMEYSFIDTDREAGVISLSNGGKSAYVNEEILLSAKGDASHLIQLEYDDFEVSHEYFLNLSKGGKQSIKNYAYEDVVPENDEIRDTPGGWLAEKSTGFNFYNMQGQKISPVDYEEVIVGKKSYAVRVGGKWGVINFEGELFIQNVYDTIHFVEDKGILLEQGKKKLGYFYKDDLTDFTKYRSLNIQSAKLPVDSVSYEYMPFIITEDARRKKGLLSGDGYEILGNKYQKITLLDEEMVMIENYGKRGLANLRGKTVLKPSYEVITHYKDAYFSLFKTKKFGLFNAKTSEVIAPEYDATLKLYGQSDSIFIAKKGQFGFVDKHNEVVADFQFDDVRYWNDTVSLVRHEAKWKLYNFSGNYFLPETFDTFEYLYNTPENVVIVTYRSSGYGLLSNHKGRLIQEEYTEIINLGDETTPFYLVEREISQAGKYVMLYINEEGEVVKDQLLEEPDYVKIACYDE
ncbi:WG repeat-containing protein [Flammeovirgaceae bacterium SG7u.111]|nr:WG repeat-containing protein [Flammeovirgaceae bacterium SG7u.132]WPO34326.1 WG repeat-containing protein [Flammeovirgaceae bacterium SG7u.111]